MTCNSVSYRHMQEQSRDIGYSVRWCNADAEQAHIDRAFLLVTLRELLGAVKTVCPDHPIIRAAVQDIGEF